MAQQTDDDAGLYGDDQDLTSDTPPESVDPEEQTEETEPEEAAEDESQDEQDSEEKEDSSDGDGDEAEDSFGDLDEKAEANDQEVDEEEDEDWDPKAKPSDNFRAYKAKTKAQISELQKKVSGLPDDFTPENYEAMVAIREEHEKVKHENQQLREWREQFDLQNSPAFQEKFDISGDLDRAVELAKGLGIGEKEVRKLASMNEFDQDARLDTVEAVVRQKMEEEEKTFSPRTFSKFSNAMEVIRNKRESGQSALQDAAATREKLLQEQKKTAERQAAEQAKVQQERVIVGRATALQDLSRRFKIFKMERGDEIRKAVEEGFAASKYDEGDLYAGILAREALVDYRDDLAKAHQRIAALQKMLDDNADPGSLGSEGGSRKKGEKEDPDDAGMYAFSAGKT